MKRAAIFKKLKHQIRFLENLSIDEFEAENWQEKFTAYAEVLPICDNSLSVFDNFSFGNLITEAFFVFRIRFMKGITTKMRILFKGRQFEIKRLINIEERDRVIKILALELG